MQRRGADVAGAGAWHAGVALQAGSPPGSLGSRLASHGALLAIVAAGLWSLNGALVKLIYQNGDGPHRVTIAFYRSLFAGICRVPLARGRFRTLGARRAATDGAQAPGPRTARL